MSSNCYKYRSFNMSFIIGEQCLHQIDEVYRDFGEAAQWLVAYRDGSTISYETLNDVLKVLNSSNAAINRIKISSKLHHNTRIELKFSDDGLSRSSVEYDINSDEKNVTLISNKLDSIIKEQTQWYSFLDRSFLNSYIFLCITIFPFALIHIIFMTMSNSKIGFNFQTIFPAFIYMLTLNKSLKYLFPVGTFLIGYGKERNRKLTFIRNLFGTFVLGVLASAVASLLLEMRGK